MKFTREIKKLIMKLNDENHEPLTKQEISLALTYLKMTKYYLCRRKEELCIRKFAYDIKNRKENRDELINLFNQYCKVRAWFYIEYLPDGGEMLQEKDPFSGFDIEIEQPEAFYDKLQELDANREFIFEK